MARKACIALAILLGCFALAACGRGEAGEERGDVELRLWVFSPDVERDLEPALAEFEAENPGITVAVEQLPWDRGFEKILLSLATGRPPDVCELGMTWLAGFASQDVLTDLTEQMEPTIDDRVLVDTATYNGRLYAAPWMVGTRMFFYNRELLREAGYDDALPPETWEELAEMSAAVDALGEKVHGIGLPAGDTEITWQTFYSFLASANARLYDTERKQPLLESEGFLETLRFYRSLKPHALVDRGAQLDRAFGSGEIGFHVSGAWNFVLLPRDYPLLDYGYAPLPSPGGEGGGAMAGGQLLVGFKRSKHPGEARKLIAFLSRPEIMARLTFPIKSVLPALKNAEELPKFREDPARRFHAGMIERAMAPPAVPYWEDMREDIVTLMDTALLTEASLEELIERTSEHWNDLAEDYGLE